MKYNKNDNNDNKNKTTTTTLLLYRCVYCGTPCHSLYRQLSSSSHSIKLTTCIACNQVVDPYIEREILLIVIDCILLREEAYRHVLYNRLLLMLMMNGKNNNEATAAAVDNNNTMDIFSSSSSFNSVVFTWKRALQVLLSWCILDTYLIWETLKISQRLALATEDYSSSSPTTSITNTDVEDVVDVTDNNNNIILPELYHITFIAMISISGIVLQWMTIYWYLQQRQQRQRQQYQRRQQQSQQQQQHYDNNKNNNIFNYHLVLLKIQIYLALIVPSSFAHVVTILVLIWENTTTIVHLLGYILIASWQCLALSVLSYNNNNNSSTYSSYPSVDNPLQEDETSKSQKIIDNTTDNKEKRKTTTATTTKITTTTFTLRPFLVGLFVRILWKLVCSYFLPKLLMLVVGTGTTTTTTTTTASSYHETLNFQLPCVGSLDIRFPLSLGSFVHYLRGDTYEFESSIVSICLT